MSCPILLFARPDLPPVDGEQPADLLARTCVQAALPEPHTAQPTDALQGPAILLDPTFPALSADSLRALARASAEHGARLCAPDGRLLAVSVPKSFEGTLDEARRADARPTLAADAAEALDVTDPWSRQQLAASHRHQRLVALIRAGVNLPAPDRVLIDREVTLQPGCTIWPDVVLRGATRVGAGAEIRPGCWLQDTEVGERALVKSHTVCEGAIIGPGAQVGPMAHLRPGTRLSEAVKVGNFVEVKNTTLHRGAKASHLTYLGDAEIGAEANVGAGTITCNYDGFRKHRTVIGARAFVGSNTALVAPVSVGEGAIVGAGSVLTRDVPDDALALERAELRVLPDKGRRLNARNRRLAEQAKRDR